jgi:hypothetical protein
MGRCVAVGRHDLGQPNDPASRWLLHMADKDGAASVGQTSHSTNVVRAYVNSFRWAGLQVGLYYSILSLRDDIRHFNITPAKVRLIKDQLTELLTGYGEVDILITDGWDAPRSRITYKEVPFPEIYEHIKNLQPNCLLCDLNASQGGWCCPARTWRTTPKGKQGWMEAGFRWRKLSSWCLRAGTVSMLGCEQVAVAI